MASIVRMDVKEVLRHFKQLEDPRSPVNRLHPLDSVIVIAIMAVLAGANGPTAIANWAKIKSDILLKLLDLPNGIPRKDVYRRVLATLKPDAFQACFTMWLTALRAAAAEVTGVDRPTLAIDGKTLRRSHDCRRNLGALHSVSVWASEFGLTLAQVATEEKSNEITAIPTLLSLVDIHGAIITIDAMGTQTAIAEKIIDGGGDFVLALKGNQGTLHDATIDYINEQTKTDFRGIGAVGWTPRKRNTVGSRNEPTSRCPPPRVCRDSVTGRDCSRSGSQFSAASATEKRPQRCVTSSVVCPSK